MGLPHEACPQEQVTDHRVPPLRGKSRDPRGMKESSFIKKRESRKGMLRAQTGGMAEKRVRPTAIRC